MHTTKHTIVNVPGVGYGTGNGLPKTQPRGTTFGTYTPNNFHANIVRNQVTDSTALIGKVE